MKFCELDKSDAIIGNMMILFSYEISWKSGFCRILPALNTSPHPSHREANWAS